MRDVIEVIAHRGASDEAPENTLSAVRAAVARDADRVEVDVQRTKDGALVLMHDTTLARTTDVRRAFPRRAPWLVKDLTLAEVKRLDAGSWLSPAHCGERVPTLQEVIDVLRPTRTGLLIELKATALHPGLSSDVAQALTAIPGYIAETVDAHRLTVQSFDHEAALIHKHLVPEVPVGALGAPSVPELGAYAAWAAEINPLHRIIDRRYIDVVHRHGMRCNVWTVNRAAHMRRAIEFGVDGVITNRPRELRELVGWSLPSDTRDEWPQRPPRSAGVRRWLNRSN